MNNNLPIRLSVPVTSGIQDVVKSYYGVDAEATEAAEEITKDGDLSLLVKLKPVVETINLQIEASVVKA